MNILTSLLMSSNSIYNIQSLMIFMSGVLFILSGIMFSWLTYWVKKYLEFSNHSIDVAASKIREDKKEGKFKRKYILAPICSIIAIILLFMPRGI